MLCRMKYPPSDAAAAAVVGIPFLCFSCFVGRETFYERASFAFLPSPPIRMFTHQAAAVIDAVPIPGEFPFPSTR